MNDDKDEKKTEMNSRWREGEDTRILTFVEDKICKRIECTKLRGYN